MKKENEKSLKINNKINNKQLTIMYNIKVSTKIVLRKTLLNRTHDFSCLFLFKLKLFFINLNNNFILVLIVKINMLLIFYPILYCLIKDVVLIDVLQ